jgi:hypothetical protein
LATDPTSTPYWHYWSPDEAELLPAVSAETLMAHTRVMAARKKESGTPGEAQSYDHIEALKSYGYAVGGARSRPSSACRRKAGWRCPTAR